MLRYSLKSFQDVIQQLLGASPVSGLASPTAFLGSLASPLTTPRGTPRGTPVPGGHRALSEEDYANIIQSMLASGAITSTAADEQTLLKEGWWIRKMVFVQNWNSIYTIFPLEEKLLVLNGTHILGNLE